MKNTRPVTEQEFKDFMEAMEEYSNNKKIKKQKFNESLLYSIYTKMKKATEK